MDQAVQMGAFMDSARPWFSGAGRLACLTEFLDSATMTPEELGERMMRLALRVLKMTDALPRTAGGRNVASQVSRSACSMAANYRAAQRARSHAEFVSKIGIVLEEADETAFWVELADRAGYVPSRRLSDLQRESAELLKIVASIRRSARRRS